jgi:peptidoglycan/xylan/chitin deacetylase (PgdA/CDA1 family)
MSGSLRALTAMLSPGGARTRLAAFYFHRVPAEPDPMLPDEPHADAFAEIIVWIAEQFRVVDPRELPARLAEGRLPRRAAIVSFDDGYRDNHDVALPLLRRAGVPAAFFVTTSFVSGGAMFNDRIIEACRRAPQEGLSASGIEARPSPVDGWAERRALAEATIAALKYLPPADREDRVRAFERACGVEPATGAMMDACRVRALHDGGMTVGGHTRTHPILRTLSDDEAFAEIAGCRADLTALLGVAPALFAYPNGRRGRDFDERHERMVARAGFECAFSTEPGAARGADSRWALPRFTPWDRTRMRFGLRAAANLLRAG